MHPTTHLFALLALITIAAATNHDVSVGSDSYVYAPDSVTAAPDDTVTFHFYPGNHSVVQSDFDSPCSSSNGIFSGYVNSESGASSTTFVVTITDTNPIWLFCSQTEHCQSGMVMVINPPSSGDTLAAYAAAATKTLGSTAPANVKGGVLSNGSGSSSSSVPVSSASSAESSSTNSAGHSASSASSASSVGSANSASSSVSSTPASTSGSQASTSSSTSASASATKNAGSVVGKDVVLSGLGSVVAVVAFWIGLV